MSRFHYSSLYITNPQLCPQRLNRQILQIDNHDSCAPTCYTRQSWLRSSAVESVYIRDLAYCLLLLSFRVTGARSLGFRACPPLLSRSAETRRRISRACLCATFERPAFLFLFPARDHDPFFFCLSSSLSSAIHLLFFSLPLSLSRTRARANIFNVILVNTLQTYEVLSISENPWNDPFCKRIARDTRTKPVSHRREQASRLFRTRQPKCDLVTFRS